LGAQLSDLVADAGAHGVQGGQLALHLRSLFGGEAWRGSRVSGRRAQLCVGRVWVGQRWINHSWQVVVQNHKT
jgi:hypothetical protein